MTVESYLNSDFKAILDHLPTGCFIIDFEWRCRYVNAIGAQQVRKTPNELLGQKVTEVYPGSDQAPAFQTLTQCMTARTSATLNTEFVYPDGATAWFELRVQPVPDGLLVTSWDTTERQSAQAALQFSETRYRRLFEAAQDGILILDADTGQITDVNPFLEKMLGYSHTDLLGRRLWEIGPFKDIAATQAAFLELQSSGYIRYEDLPLETRDGRHLNVEFISNVYLVDRRRVIQCNIRDITTRKQAEDARQKLSRALKLLSECNQILVRADDEQRLLADICWQIVETGSFRMAWVGLAEHDETKRVRPIAQFGLEDGYLEQAQITWADTERGRGPTGTAVRTGLVQINQNFLTNPVIEPWREAALARGYQSSIALPLKDTDSTFGVLTIYSAQPDAFDSEEARLLTELANDLAYGLNALRARAAHQRAEKALQDSENRYRRITEGLTDYQYSVRLKNGRPVETRQSSTCLHVTGYGAEEFAANPNLWIDMVAPEDRELVLQRVQQVLAGMDIPPIEHRLIRKDGDIRWVSDTIILFKDAAGNLVSYDGVIKDITERKRAEEALRLSEGKYRALFSEMLNGCALHAIICNERGEPIDYVTLEVNNAFESILGIKAEDVVGHKASENLPPEELKHWLTVFGLVALTGESVGYEMYSPLNQKYFEGNAYCPERGKFAVTFSDVTARKQAEEALQISEERLRSLYENSTVGIYRTTPDGRILMANPALIKILGYNSFDELAARNLQQAGFEPEYSRTEFLETIERAGEIKGLEAVWTRHDGKAIYIRESARVVRDPRSQTLYYDGIIEDITERQKAIEALRASEERFRALVENSADVIALVTSEGLILYESPAVRRVLGYQPEEMVGHNGFEFLHPNDSAAGIELFSNLLLPHHRPVTTELRYKRKDGSWAWVEATGTNLLAEPSVQAIVINYQDITQRKQASQEIQARNRELSVLYAISSHATQSSNFEQALDATLATTLAALDAEVGGIYLQAAGELTLRLQAFHGPIALRSLVERSLPASSLVGRLMDTQAPIVMNIDDLPTDRLPLHVMQAGLRSMVAVPLVAGGNALGTLIVSTYRDHAFPADDLKMLAAIGHQLGGDIQAIRTRELAAANERLQELDRLKSKFVSDVSHELRTPITALSLNVDLLEHGKPEKHAEYLRAIRQQVKRQVQLLEDILNLSRLELGADRVRFAPVALNALIVQTIAVHQPSAAAKNVTLTFTPYDELPTVPGEENQLAQVISNLLSNAVNYTLAGEIRVSTALTEHHVVIEVRDTGVGIAPEDVPHLFERFYRGSRTRDIRGTGLGLAIIQEIVNLHAGRVEVESEVDVGTTFRVYLPLTPRSAA